MPSGATASGPGLATIARPGRDYLAGLMPENSVVEIVSALFAA
jgi:hypothetical protein